MDHPPPTPSRPCARPVSPERSFDWYAQRGWHAPNVTAILPNVMGAMGASAPAQPQSKKVWRLAFFGRLEERKGLVRARLLHEDAMEAWLCALASTRPRALLDAQKLFVEAVEGLPASMHQAKGFEVVMVGANAWIDNQPSTDWLQSRTVNWSWPHKVLANVPRAQALHAVKQDGILLVLCSMVEVRVCAKAHGSGRRRAGSDARGAPSHAYRMRPLRWPRPARKPFHSWRSMWVGWPRCWSQARQVSEQP